MNHHVTNELLNDLLVEIHRSLVQYVSEAWPWTTAQSAELEGIVLSIAERQREDAGRIVHLLRERGHYIDLGVYPVEYTSLHYVAIEYLYAQLLDNQQSLVKLLDNALPQFSIDPEAKALVSQIALAERDAFKKLLLIDMDSETEMDWMK